MKSIKWFKANTYDKWSLTNKIFFWLAIAGIFLTIFFSGNKTENNNYLSVVNSNLTNSLIIQGSPNTTVIYDSTAESMDTSFYEQGIDITWHGIDALNKFNASNLKVIMPDGSVAYLESADFNETVRVGACNDEMTDCYIIKTFRSKFSDDKICFIVTIKSGKDHQLSNELSFSKRFQNKPEECLKN